MVVVVFLWLSLLSFAGGLFVVCLVVVLGLCVFFDSLRLLL